MRFRSNMAETKVEETDDLLVEQLDRDDQEYKEMRESFNKIESARPNYCSIVIFILTICVGQFAGRFTASSNLQPTLTAKFDWTEKQSNLLYTLLVFSAVIGEISGAVIGSRVMRLGRRKTLMYGGILTLSGNCLLQVLNIYPVFLLGYFCMSLGTGFIFVISPRYIEEIVPKRFFSVCMAIMVLS